MAEGCANAAILLAAYSGWLLLALRQSRHAAAVSGKHLDPRARNRALFFGVSLLAASFAGSLWTRGPAFGSLFGVLIVSLAALIVTFTLSWRPNWARLLARVL